MLNIPERNAEVMIPMACARRSEGGNVADSEVIVDMVEQLKITFRIEVVQCD